jgi:hypothetical protein
MTITNRLHARHQAAHYLKGASMIERGQGNDLNFHDPADGPILVDFHQGAWEGTPIVGPWRDTAANKDVVIVCSPDVAGQLTVEESSDGSTVSGVMVLGPLPASTTFGCRVSVTSPKYRMTFVPFQPAKRIHVATQLRPSTARS